MPMKPAAPIHLVLPLALAAISFSSCAKMARTAKNLDFKTPNFRKLLPGKQSKIPVVAVRSKDLQKNTDGEAKALAYQRQRRARQDFSAPRDFTPEDLPADAGLPTHGILPPLTPGSGSGFDFDKPIPKLNVETSE